MCKWGTNTILKLKISADLNCTGIEEWKNIKIDSCIADLVKALQDSGIDMYGSCCGHGKGEGYIDLADGRQLLILDPKRGAQYNLKVGDGLAPIDNWLYKENKDNKGE